MTLSAPQPHIEKAAVTQRSTTTNVWSVQVSPVSIEPPDFYAVVTTAGSDKNGGGEKVKSSDPASTFCWHRVTDNYSGCSTEIYVSQTETAYTNRIEHTWREWELFCCKAYETTVPARTQRPTALQMSIGRSKSQVSTNLVWWASQDFNKNFSIKLWT